MKASGVFRDALARGNAIRQLAAAYDRWAEEEQTLVAEGRYVEAEGAHVTALAVLKAYRAEIDDPKPEWVECGCGLCQKVYMA